jgi:uncharacterized membrane-anchored protein YhcB (DUF1043 family)
MKKGVVKNIFIWTGIILIDLVVYIILGMLLMQYDDFYDESQGAYWSLESMNFWQKVNYVGLNLWHLINLILIGYLIYRFIRKLRKTPYNNV